MLTPLRIVFFYIAGLPFLAGCLLLFIIENTAITQSNWSLTAEDIVRAKSIVSNTTSKSRKTISLNEKDLNIALSYLLNYYTPSSSKIVVNKTSLHFTIALTLNKNHFGKYLNFNFKLIKQHGYPIIKSLQIGQIKVADEFAGLFLESIIKYTPLKEYYILAAQHISDIQLHKKGLTIVYNSSPQFNLGSTLGFNVSNYQSIVFYQQQIGQIIAKHDPKWRLSLAELLQPLFQKAYQRSTLNNAISENRAVLIAISTYVNKSEIQAFFHVDFIPNTEKTYSASMYRREDMARHFMISAALASAGAESLAYILGQEKELHDAKRGSGFSFIDLACDRAGLQFGKTAIASAKKARLLQQRMAIIKDYTAFMPDVRDLPENMNNTAFKYKFTSIYSEKYQNMLKKIDLRIAQLPIYQ